MSKSPVFCILLLLISVTVFSQEKEVYIVKGQIIDSQTEKPLKNTHVLNLNSVIGTTSNVEGFFKIPTQINDTIYISHIGYSSIKLKITNDLLKGNDMVISLFEKNNEIQEVVVKTHNLIGVLEIDAKNVPRDKYNRIRINGLPQTYETGRPKPKEYSSPIAAIFNPLDFLYNRFGKKPKELRKLKKLRNEDNLREMFKNNYNREILLEYLEMDMADLKTLLDNCNYSEYYVERASDLQMIDAILDCYENYKALQKGSTK